MDEDILAMSEKYPKAADLLDSAIMVISDAYNLEPIGPPHDVAECMLFNYFTERKEDKTT